MPRAQKIRMCGPPGHLTAVGPISGHKYDAIPSWHTKTLPSRYFKAEHCRLTRSWVNKGNQ